MPLLCAVTSGTAPSLTESVSQEDTDSTACSVWESSLELPPLPRHHHTVERHLVLIILVFFR